MKEKLFLLFCMFFISLAIIAQVVPDKIDPGPFGDNARHWYGIADSHNLINAEAGKPKYRPADIKEVADNIILFQKSNGGWPKNYDMFAILTNGQKKRVLEAKNEVNTTFDNGSCYTQIRALAIAYAHTKDDRYKNGAIKGLDYIIEAQYKNGGWPQYYPLQNNYSRKITYNDGAMIGIMNLLKDIVIARDPLYAFIDQNEAERLRNSYRQGIDCILKTQIEENGVLTAWCQQHDEITLAPVWARKFEPSSICNAESTAIVEFLMNIDHPDQKVKEAIQAAIRWFKSSEILHTRIKTVPATAMQTPFRISKTDKIVVVDFSAPPIWARYYELGTHRPLFCNRDSKVVYSLDKVERERRDGYGWYSYAPQNALNRYPAWEKKWTSESSTARTR